MQIKPVIHRNPYTEAQFMEMTEKLDQICDDNLSNQFLTILRHEVTELAENSKTLNREVCRRLLYRMAYYSKQSPCMDAFFNSVFLEIYKTFRNHPIETILKFIDKITLMSKK